MSYKKSAQTDYDKSQRNVSKVIVKILGSPERKERTNFQDAKNYDTLERIYIFFN